MTHNLPHPKTERAELKNPPLARVLAQIRWPDLTTFDLDQAASRIVEDLGTVYPFKREETEVEVLFNQSGVLRNNAEAG